MSRYSHYVTILSANQRLREHGNNEEADVLEPLAKYLHPQERLKNAAWHHTRLNFVILILNLLHLHV